VISVAGVLVAGWMLDAPWLITAAVAPKAATMPVALSLAKSVGADQTIVVTAVLLTGVVGTLLTPPLLRWLGVRDKRVQAFALGVSAHAIGLVRAQAEYPDHLDLAVAGMCGNALVTTILCSFLLFWTHG
jgi:putative effector of murein hydrolase